MEVVLLCLLNSLYSTWLICWTRVTPRFMRRPLSGILTWNYSIIWNQCLCFQHILTYSVQRESQRLTQVAEGWGLHTIDGEPQGRNTLHSSMGRKRLLNFFLSAVVTTKIYHLKVFLKKCHVYTTSVHEFTNVACLLNMVLPLYSPAVQRRKWNDSKTFDLLRNTIP